MTIHHHTTLLCAASLLAAASLSFAGTKISSKKEVKPVADEDIVVHPVTSPYFAEDSFITSDIRPVFVYHNLPSNFLGGGSASVTAVQVRLKLTDSLQFVAYKDGWLDVSTRGFGARGWNDIAAGVKWAFYRNDAAQLHAALGLGYEFASGDRRVLQRDDELRAWLSVNKGFGKLHLGATLNYNWSMGNGGSLLGDSDWLSWHFHADYQVCRYFSPLIEVNGYHTTRGNGAPFSVADVANISNRGGATISAAVGAEVRPLKWLALRAAFEFPLTNNVDVFGNRLTFSSVIRF
ncbi:MAG: hypothetical protein ABIP20_00110 [Chthoniobacteraceae bacterium]